MAEERKIKSWITIGGKHIPIYENESSADAVMRFKDKQIDKDNDLKEKQIKAAEQEAKQLKDKYEDDEHHPSTLKAVKKGDYFKLSNKPNATVYVKDYYDRSEKSFWIYKAEDVNDGRFMKATKKVYVGFTY